MKYIKFIVTIALLIFTLANLAERITKKNRLNKKAPVFNSFSSVDFKEVDSENFGLILEILETEEYKANKSKKLENDVLVNIIQAEKEGEENITIMEIITNSPNVIYKEMKNNPSKGIICKKHSTLYKFGSQDINVARKIFQIFADRVNVDEYDEIN